MGISTFSVNIPASANAWFWVIVALMVVACVALIVAAVRWLNRKDK